MYFLKNVFFAVICMAFYIIELYFRGNNDSILFSQYNFSGVFLDNMLILNFILLIAYVISIILRKKSFENIFLVFVAILNIGILIFNWLPVLIYKILFLIINVGYLLLTFIGIIIKHYNN